MVIPIHNDSASDYVLEAHNDSAFDYVLMGSQTMY